MNSSTPLRQLLTDLHSYLRADRRLRAVGQSLAGLSDSQMKDIGVHWSELDGSNSPRSVFDPLSIEMRRTQL